MLRTLDRAYDARTRDSPYLPLLTQLLSGTADAFAAIGDLEQAIARIEQALEVATESAAPASTLETYRLKRDLYVARRSP